ncbi:MAG TPA: hypothetical protein VL443_16195 [Cyclobacteriaceae bacterium]|nr:hypothetical protein [Cyclobacteriaceae bacterium]
MGFPCLVQANTFTSELTNITAMKFGITSDEIIALEIEIDILNDDYQEFFFTEAILNIIQTNLKTVYSEVFIWTVENHLSVWVVGKDSTHLVKSFTKYRHNFTRMLVWEAFAANNHFNSILECNYWNNCSALSKAESFNRGYEAAKKTNSLGPTLLPLINEGLHALSEHAFILGARNAWQYASTNKNDILSDSIFKLKAKDLFYRISVN